MRKKIKILAGVGIAVVCLVALFLLMREQPPYEPPDQYPQVVEAKEVPSNESLRLWENFKAKYGQHWQADWNSYTDAPSEISGPPTLMGFGDINSEETADMAAKNFLTENQGLLKVRTPELRLTQVYKTNGGWNVKYQQYYKNIPVDRAEVFVVMTGDGKIDMVKNTFHPNINITTIPRIPRWEAILISGNEFLKSSETGVSVLERVKNLIIQMVLVVEWGDTDLMVYPAFKTLEYRLAWRISFPHYYIFVDAINGEVLRIYSTIKS